MKNLASGEGATLETIHTCMCMCVCDYSADPSAAYSKAGIPESSLLGAG